MKGFFSTRTWPVDGFPELELEVREGVGETPLLGLSRSEVRWLLWKGKELVCRLGAAHERSPAPQARKEFQAWRSKMDEELSRDLDLFLVGYKYKETTKAHPEAVAYLEALVDAMVNPTEHRQ